MVSRVRSRAFRVTASITIAFALAGLAAAGCYALLQTLPRPTRADLVAVKELTRLDHLRGVNTITHLGSRSYISSCRRRGQVEVITIGKQHVVAIGAHLERARIGPNEATQARRAQPLLAAAADLAACPGILASELARQLRQSSASLVRYRWRELALYALRLSDGKPIVTLFLRGHSDLPTGVNFRSRHLTGWSEITLRSSNSPFRPDERNSLHSVGE
jgi:hypothetical protein